MDSEIKNQQDQKELFELEKIAKEARKTYLKTSCIQNLKLFKGIVNFSMPFILSATIASGVVFGFSGSLPFVQDEIKKTKRIDFSCVDSTIIDSTSHYENRWWTTASTMPQSKIVIETPWIYEEGEYKKDIITYSASNITDEKIIDSIITGDIDYILTTYDNYSNLETVSTPTPQEVGGSYIVNADIHMLDKEKIISHLESQGTNIGITILDIILGFAAGAYWAYKRDFSIKATLNDVKFNIHEAEEEYKKAVSNYEKKLTLKKEAK